MTTPIFDDTHSKIIEISSSFSEFAPACKKSIHSILEGRDHAGYIYF